VPSRPSLRRHPKAVALALAALVAGGTLGGLAVATDALGAGYAFSRVVARVELLLDPPPDRTTLPTVATDPRTGAAAPSPAASPAPSPVPSASVLGGADSPLPPSAPPLSPSPSPLREPVDVRLPLDADAVFSHQATKEWCAPAGVTIVLAALGLADNSEAMQAQLQGRVGDWESWADSHDGGWGPASIAQALAAYGATGYEIRGYQTREDALFDAAAAIDRTRSPVVLIAWYGAHTWIMTGYRADADPTLFQDAEVSGAYIYDPWYPWISTLWGPSDAPGTFQDAAEMRRNFLPWDRPEGLYPERDGLFISVVPTIPR
jgi:hypothetical protein